jgi:signal transduction histidine kinase
MRTRLQFQIFRALAVTVLTAVLLVVGCMWLFFHDVHPLPRFAGDLGELIVDHMPPPENPGFRREFARRARRLNASMCLWDREARELACEGRRRPPRPAREIRKRGFAVAESDAMFVRLDDGRLLAVQFDHGMMRGDGAKKSLVAILFLVGVLLLGSHWAAKRIVRRLKVLEATVARFGAGDLSARVELYGRDEIARLGEAFNRNFARIAGLLRQQRRMLQSASHELRSPLTRVRMAFELATDPDVDVSTRERLRGEAGRDIEELDALIGDLLMAARLSDTELPREWSGVPLTQIVREEAAKVNATAELAELSITGNARMLRSLVRNLLENARRYGKDPIVVKLEPHDGHVVLSVEDAGEGVPDADRERIFEPFYRREGHREGRDGGVGLGLALVRNIAEHHDGSARYLPRQGGGSRFEVELPRR